jgi:hypothetical protein
VRLRRALWALVVLPCQPSSPEAVPSGCYSWRPFQGRRWPGAAKSAVCAGRNGACVAVPRTWSFERQVHGKKRVDESLSLTTVRDETTARTYPEGVNAATQRRIGASSARRPEHSEAEREADTCGLQPPVVTPLLVQSRAGWLPLKAARAGTPRRLSRRLSITRRKEGRIETT